MATRDIRWQLGIDWNSDGSYVSAETTELANRLITATGNYRINAPGTPTVAGGGIVSQCTLILNNYDGRYSTNDPDSYIFNAGSSNGKYHHAPMFLKVSIDGGSNYHSVFAGVVVNMTEVGPTPNEASTVTIDCRDYSEKYLNQRSSTLIESMASLYANGATESDLIEQFLDDAGISNLIADPGMFVVPFGWMDDESCIEECWSLASACGGWFYANVWDSASIEEFVYKNAQHWIGETISTSAPDNQLRRQDGDYQAIQITHDHNELFNEVTVEWSSRVVDSEGVVWEPEQPIFVPANGTKSVTAIFRTPVYDISTLTYSAATSGGIDISSSVSDDLSSATKYAQRIEITFTNSHTTYAAVLKNVKLTGKPVVGGPDGESTNTASPSAVAAYWDNGTRLGKKRALRSNVWLQTAVQSETLSAMLVDVHELPTAFYTLSGVKGDPRRTLGQKIQIYDEPAFSAVSEKAYIIGLDFTLGQNGFLQNIQAIDSEALYAYIESSPGYFELGTSRIATGDGSTDSGSDRGRLFY